jgi:hypothetical protein
LPGLPASNRPPLHDWIHAPPDRSRPTIGERRNPIRCRDEPVDDSRRAADRLAAATPVLRRQRSRAGHTPEVEEGQLADRTRFRRVFSTAPFNPQVVNWLANRPDRAEYNLPSQFRKLQQNGVRDGFLPSYLIETADRKILAYTNVSEDRDEFLEALCTKTSIEGLIEAQGFGNPADIWQKWLARSTVFGGGRLHAAGNGIWQVVLPADAFGDQPRLSLARIGSYQFRDNHFIQVWCADARIRQKALKERSLGIATLPEVMCMEDLQARIRDLAGDLRVPEVSIDELRKYADLNGDERRLNRLTSLARERA